MSALVRLVLPQPNLLRFVTEAAAQEGSALKAAVRRMCPHTKKHSVTLTKVGYNFAGC